MVIEGPVAIVSSIYTSPNLTELIVAVVVGGLLAFTMVVVEYTLISHTSVLTLSVAGIFKELVTITTSLIIFHDKLNPIMIVGLCISLVGIVMYNQIRVHHVVDPTDMELKIIDPNYWEVLNDDFSEFE